MIFLTDFWAFVFIFYDSSTQQVELEALKAKAHT